MQKPNEKLLIFVIILLWEVIYAHFYNWDRLLDFVSVVYYLIELIIEASLLSTDYSTLDSYTQHTSLMFNKCLFHLCGCTCLNVMCVCSTICGSNQIFFVLFVCFWKWFVSPIFFKVFQIFLVWKTCFLGVFVTHFMCSSIGS